jgi:hypothetical protein
VPTTTAISTTTLSTKPESVTILDVSPSLLPLDNPYLTVECQYSTNMAGATVKVIVEKPGSSENIAQLATGVVITTIESKTSGTISYSLVIDVKGIAAFQPLNVHAEVVHNGDTLSSSAVITIQTSPVTGGGACVDEHADCGFWGNIGHCDPNSSFINYMMHKCKRTCQLCATESPIANPPTATTTNHNIFAVTAPSGSKTATVTTLSKTATAKTITTATGTSATTTTPAGKVISEQSCTFFGWKLRFKNKHVCGESDAGLGKCQKKVPKWTTDARCTGAGARLCTRDELSGDAARGTGCGLDKDGALVWTSDPCTTTQRQSGFWTVGGSSRANTEAVCKSVWSSSKAGTRCCADVQPEKAAVGMLVAGTEGELSAAMYNGGGQTLPPIENIDFPDNYSDEGESSFRTPPPVPPMKVANELSDVNSTAFETTQDSAEENGDFNTSMATAIASVAFLLMVGVIVAVSRYKADHQDDVELGETAGTTTDTTTGEHQGQSTATVNRPPYAPHFVSTSSLNAQNVAKENSAGSDSTPTSAATPLPMHLLHEAVGETPDFVEPGFVLDTAGSFRVQSVHRQNPLITDSMATNKPLLGMTRATTNAATGLLNVVEERC